jgi:hypothetical protein
MGSRIRRVGGIVIGVAIPLMTLAGANAALPRDSVGTPQLKDGAVKNSKLGFQAVDQQKLAREAVTPVKLAPGAVKRGRLNDGAVNSAKVAEGSLKGSDIDQLSLDFAILQRRIATICPPGNAIRAVARNGQVTCQPIGGGDWNLFGNAGTDPATDFLGTTDATPLNLRVNDARALRLEPDPTSPSLIGGHGDNGVTDGASGATISGGGHDGDPNRVTDDFGTVGGGEDNRVGDNAGTTSDKPDATVGGGAANIASGDASTVGGGESNTASALNSLVAGGAANTASGLQATVGGGLGNRATQRIATVSGGTGNTANGNGATIAGGASNSASGPQATVAGGELNFANAEQSALGGGFANTAGGVNATVPGGAFNQAGGDFSFAAGRRARAANDGAFVWADSTNAVISSTANDQFIARAGGGFFLTSTNRLPEDQGLINTSAGANPNGTNGAYLSAGGVWTDVSGEDAKEGFRAVKPTAVLRKVAGLPVKTWSYRSEPGVRHLGPVAEDFHRAFGLGADDRHIASLDTGGVALAAIKGLNRTVRKQGRQIARLRGRLGEVERNGR